MDLAQGVRAAVARDRAARAYLGTVTAVDTTALSLTVDIGTGTPLTGVRWITPFSLYPANPTVGDFVAVQAFGASWWAVGKNSKNLAGPPTPGQSVPGTAVIPASRLLWADSGKPQGGTPWVWSDFIVLHKLAQGRSLNGGARDYAMFADLSGFPGSVPSGATVTSMKVRVSRPAPSAFFAPEEQKGPVTIQLGTASAVPASGQTPTDIRVLGPWRPGTVTPESSATWDLPSAWATALLSGAAKGLLTYSTAPADLAQISAVEVVVSYTLPA